MRNIVMKYLAALLVVWYSLSIIGFDVHSCTKTGETFVASIAAGVSCEDIHPEHSCSSHGNCCGQSHVKDCCGHDHDKNCCGHDDRNKISSDDCCQDDFRVLAFTGAVSANDYRNDDCASDFVAYAAECFAQILVPACSNKDYIKFKDPDSGVFVPDSQALLSIWRI